MDLRQAASGILCTFLAFAQRLAQCLIVIQPSTSGQAAPEDPGADNVPQPRTGFRLKVPRF